MIGSVGVVYTIATVTNECYGHGDFGSEQRICRQGVYGTGSFPPVFVDRCKAEEYLSTLEWDHDKVIVQIELVK